MPFLHLLRSRRLFVLLIAAVLFILALLGLSRAVAFANLFGLFREHAGIKITQQQIADDRNATSSDQRVPVVTQRIHQIYHSWSGGDETIIPEHWEKARQSCIELNPSWEYKLWGTNESRNFIEENYPWFLKTYDSYKYPVQRVDVLRYFLLRQYGGIYLDMDNGCSESLEPLIYYPAFVTDGGQGTLSNNIMGGQPDHPFFHLLTENLIAYKWNWLFPNFIICYQSGQWFVTAMWEKYHALLSSDGTVDGFSGSSWAPLHHILMDMRPGGDPWVYFTQVRALHETWYEWDSALFGFIGAHIWLITLAGCALTGLSIWGCIRVTRWRERARGYKMIPKNEPINAP